MGLAPPAVGRARYRGRFAPSPTGLLHAGSLAAALASWLDARAHDGAWLLRIEDIDSPRCAPGADVALIGQLAACGLSPDEPPLWQSSRSPAYERALVRLTALGWAYPCGCSRAEIEQVLAQRGDERARHQELVYPGICRLGLHGKPARAMRLLAADDVDAPSHGLSVDWIDRRLGVQRQDVATDVGDIVLRRADGLWAYQLAVVVDDDHQRITDVVRGEDLADNTPRQIHLQRALGLAPLRYLHTPLVLGADGAKLSKQNGARAIDLADPLAALRAAGAVLGLEARGDDVGQWLANATAAWAARWLA